MLRFTKILTPFKDDEGIRFTAVTMLVSVVAMLITMLYINISNRIVHVFTDESFSKNSGCYVEVEIPVRSDGVKNCWTQPDGTVGAQYDIYVYNNSNLPLMNYEVSIGVPKGCRIDSSWNGEYQVTDSSISMKPLSSTLNLMIRPQQKSKFGFVLYSSELLEISEFTIKGQFICSPFKSAVFDIFLTICVISFLVFITALYTYSKLTIQAFKADKVLSKVIQLCASSIDIRDSYSRQHSSHVAEYAKTIALAMGYSESEAKNVYYNGLLHDVGKTMIPREIFVKSGELSDEEWLEMKKHTTYGAEILDGFDGVPNVRETAFFHHERWDGKGYPRGLRGEEIPLIARIIAVADSYDAMNSDRSFRMHRSREYIIEEFKKNAGLQFDPLIAQVMLDLLIAGKI